MSNFATDLGEALGISPEEVNRLSEMTQMFGTVAAIIKVDTTDIPTVAAQAYRDRGGNVPYEIVVQVVTKVIHQLEADGSIQDGQLDPEGHMHRQMFGFDDRPTALN